MFKNHNEITTYEHDIDIDKECIPLCDAMNRIPGIHTIESCCGHGKSPFHIHFDIEGLEYLPRLLYYFDGCHCGFYGWKVYVHTDCGMNPAHFTVEGPAGAYQEANHIAELLNEEIKRKS